MIYVTSQPVSERGRRLDHDQRPRQRHEGDGADINAPGLRLIATDTSFMTAYSSGAAVGGGVGVGASYATNTIKGTVGAEIGAGLVSTPGTTSS